ncbi:hypothetical protein CDG77_14575 [Nostoc sp. 'Peltigera membranacea cyanobiont' 213]|uniref:hypothetical protein n=1 Tax=Nostoc sp. 'Peltigera membranacea cyanobiont' 213 TaxID=2014530 RepID=UPI000B95C45F|nr:hypothetical protein [Nostoc sp. 'Peltigera membranacea cyanobiont' 213]OYD92247.1 hypothetical protein CDG77_14575 [Nostoc sp. 'Peltigera membranacea cyanobiont' 213]
MYEGIKGLPNKKILNYFLWGGQHERPYTKAGKMPTPQDWVIYLLEVPKDVETEIIKANKDLKSP